MRKFSVVATKLLLSVALIWYAFSKIDAASAVRELRNLPVAAILMAFALLLSQNLLAGWRLVRLIRQTGQRCGFGAAFDAVLVGAFFSQTLISFVGGDAMRVWRISRQRISLGDATRAVVLDRLLGFIGLIVLILIGLPISFDIIHDRRVQVVILLLVGSGIASCALLLSASKLPEWLRQKKPVRFIVELSIASRTIFTRARVLWPLLAVSTAIQALNVAVIYTIARGLNVEISLLYCLVLIPPVLFLSMMPISFAGWGVRESAMVAALAAVGVFPNQSLALSIGYGLALVVISLPGGLLWLHNRHKGTQAVPQIPGHSKEGEA
jgi:uncharacterized protein (TIRG00374 family)